MGASYRLSLNDGSLDRKPKTQPGARDEGRWWVRCENWGAAGAAAAAAPRSKHGERGRGARRLGAVGRMSKLCRALGVGR